jgi:Domain of unknown function (DUF5134)
MRNTAWLNDFFAGVMIVIAVYSAGRLIASRVWTRPTHRDVDVAHVLMGLSMAGQLDADLNPIPNGVWLAVFSVLAAWFVRRCYQFVKDPGTDTQFDDHVHRLSRRLVHLVMALAMVYMYLAANPARIGSGMAMGTATGATADFVLIPTIFVLVLLASSIWEIDGIGRFSPATGPLQPVTSPAQPAKEPVSVGAGPPTVADSTPGRASGHPNTDPAPVRASPWLAPRLEAGTHVVMTVTMAYMLVLML